MLLFTLQTVNLRVNAVPLPGGHSKLWFRFRRKSTERALERVCNNQNRDAEEYEDDVWCFFQNCWYLRDWIINDQELPEQTEKRVKEDVEKTPDLLICADLANSSKHLNLRFSRVDANISSRGLHIHAGLPGKGYGLREFIIEDDKGHQYDVIKAAKTAADQWRVLLNSYGVPV